MKDHRPRNKFAVIRCLLRDFGHDVGVILWFNKNGSVTPFKFVNLIQSTLNLI